VKVLTLARDSGPHEVARSGAKVGHGPIDAEDDARLGPEANYSCRGETVGLGESVDGEIGPQSRARALSGRAHTYAHEDTT
jgi:hypothetical protein